LLQERSSEDLLPIRRWLWLMAALVAAIVLVGGVTRLTGSGLSITEWRPISGVLPPLSDAAWLAEFELYRAIPQFQIVNPTMTLAEFKFIYWWEWSHRQLARLAGFAFILPFSYFLLKRRIDRRLGWKLAGVFVLGGIQGAVGWWMVQSGLAERTDVSQYRLAIHLTLASIILAALVTIAESLRARPEPAVAPKHRRIAGTILVLVLIQIFLGALVAKTGAGLTFNTWPLLDVWLVPPAEALFPIVPLWKNFFENVLLVQFDHRIVAYALVLLALAHALDAARLAPHPVATRATGLFILVTLQAALGVVALVLVVPLALAFAHQAGAIVVLAMATLHLARIRT
jgi:cytochrome c oxidase assembly protein subunit 15